VVTRLELVLPDSAESKTIAKSSVSEARKRLGHEPVKWLFTKTAQRWADAAARQDSFRGLSVYAVDGSSMRIADTPSNREEFGFARNALGDSGYPMLRLVSLMAVRSHLVAAASVGPYGEGEYTRAQELWDKVPNDSVTILDRNFLSAKLLLGLQMAGLNRHWLVRSNKRQTWKVTRSLGRWDKIVELNVRPALREEF
jgi:hypothetical protein